MCGGWGGFPVLQVFGWRGVLLIQINEMADFRFRKGIATKQWGAFSAGTWLLTYHRRRMRRDNKGRLGTSRANEFNVK
jgi:hypothetical protein